MAEFRMPALGADMTEGTLLEWHVGPGDEVHRGDIVAVVDTDKAAIEIEVFEDGVVDQLLVDPGTRVPVGAPLARLTAATPSPSAAQVPPPGPAAAAIAAPARTESPLVRRLAAEAGVDLAAVHGSGPDGVVRRADVQAAVGPRPATPPQQTIPRAVPRTGPHASPRARRRAAELGVDLATVVGTGPDGAVVGSDVEKGATTVQPVPASAVEPTSEPSGTVADHAAAMRRAIGALMARSKREIPHYYLSTTIDLTRATSWLHDINVERPVDQRLVPAALLLKAAALAARAVPDVNGFWVDDRLELSDHVHLGVAVSLRPSGLIAPAILDADTLDVDALMARLRDVVQRARAGRLRQQEMTAGTITVTNLGDNGADLVYGVIYPPQVALVGFGRVAERPWAQDGLIGARTCVVATLSGDHRAGDGHRGGCYLAALDDLLQKPEAL